MHFKISRRACLLALTIVSAQMPGQSFAQPTPVPQNPARLVIPFPPGGSVDVVARSLALQLSEALGRPVIVDNRGGGNGAIAATTVAGSVADGSTILVTTTSVIQNVILQKKTPYRLEALAPVAKLADLPVGFAVSADLPVKNLSEFVEWSRRHPKDVSYGTFGAGSSAHIMGEMLNKSAGVEMLHVPFKGEAPALAALLGKQVTAIFGATGTLAQQVKAGRLKILAVALPQRLEGFPEVQTFAEAGFPAVNQPGWLGAFVPAAVPIKVREDLNEQLMRVLKRPEIEKAFSDQGFVVAPMPTKEFSPFIGRENAVWTKAIALSGVTLD